ncbi:hypothetical protein GGH99_002784 [Coemansia sp. RSA 1285]|nr:hypothetical protein GGH99_002784 [Coemansia sp. RSA 1285]
MAMFLSRKAKSNSNGNYNGGAARNDRRRGMNELSCMACTPQNSFRFTDSQAMDVAMVLAEEYVRTADPWPTKPTGLPIEPTSPDATPEPQASGFPPPSPSWMQSPRAAATLGLRTISEELASTDADCDAMPLSAMIPPFPRPPRGSAVAPASLTSPAATLRVPSGQQCPPATIPADARGFLSLPMRSTRTRMRAHVPTAGTTSTAAASASTTSRIVSSNSTVYGSDSFPAHGEKSSGSSAFLKRRSRFSLRVKPVHSNNDEESPSSASKNPVRWIRQLFA